MKILHVSTERYWRGGEQQIAYLMNSLNQMGHENSLICNRSSKMHDYAAKENIKHFPISIKNSIDLNAVRKFVKIFNFEQPDIIHLHSSKAHSLAIIAGIFTSPQNFVLHRRVSFPIKQNWLNKWKYNAKNLKKIICISNEIAGRVMALVDRDRIEIIYSAIDLQKFNQPKSKIDLRKQYEIATDHLIIGGVGALSPEKDFETFILAAHQALQSNSKLTFLIIGEGKEKQKLFELIKKLKIERHVILMGFADHIPGLLSQLDIFMLCPISEGLGTSFLDAFASKLPVIATKTGGVPEIVKDKITGFLAAPEDAQKLSTLLLRLVENTRLRKEMGEQGYRFVQNFNLNEMASKHESLYLKILAVK